MTAPFFPYGEAEVAHLRRRDKKLAALMEELGPLERGMTPDPFEGLIGSIVSQQISTKAAATVGERLFALVGELTAENLLAVPEEQLQKCGMSMRKTQYILGIAQAASDGQVDFARLHTLPDQEIIRQLTALKGVGEWTAEMLLLFSLGRPDVVSYKDLAIRRGMERLYNHKEKGLTRADFDRYRKRYTPYGSVASLYLWALAGQG